MNSLYSLEMKYYRLPCLIVAALITGILLNIGNVIYRADQPLSGAWVLLFFCSGAIGAILGAQQYRKYISSNSWQFIFSLPKSPSSLYAILSLSGLVILAAMLLIPHTIAILITPHSENTLIDTKAPFRILFAFQCSVSSYFISHFVFSSEKRLRALPLFSLPLIIYFFTNGYTTRTILAFFALCILLFFVNASTFHPNRERRTTQSWLGATIIIPSTVMVFMFLNLFFFDAHDFHNANHSSANPQQLGHTYHYIKKLNAKRVAFKGLSVIELDQRRVWRQFIQGATFLFSQQKLKTQNLTSRISDQKYQLHHSPNHFSLSKNSQLWTFSYIHDNYFVRRNNLDKKREFLKKEHNQDTLPDKISNLIPLNRLGMFLSEHSLLEYSEKDHQFLLWYSTPDKETLLDAKIGGHYKSLVSDENIYLVYTPENFDSRTSPPIQPIIFPLPSNSYDNLDFYFFLKNNEEYMLVTVFGKKAKPNNLYEAKIIVYFTDKNGHHQELAQLPLTIPDKKDNKKYRHLVSAPLTLIWDTRTCHILHQHNCLYRYANIFEKMQLHKVIFLLALGISALCGWYSFQLMQGCHRPLRITIVCICSLFSIPAVIALILLRPLFVRDVAFHSINVS